jgi:arsenite methyltransferase
MSEASNITQAVKEKYGEAAQRASSGGVASCGTSPSSACCGGDAITANLYHSEQTADIAEQAVLASLGCGNPTALARLEPGEIVLDLGSGGGIDVLLSAKRVSPSGKAYGWT